MSNDTVMTVTVKGIGDFSDVVSNVGSVQKALTKLKLPDKLGDNLNKNITAFYKEYEKYQKKISEGIKTQGDYNQVEKSLNNMRNLYQAIGKDAQKLTQLDMKDMLNLDTGEFKKIMDELTSVIKQIGSTKIDTTPFTKAFKDIQGITKNSKISGENGLLNQILGSINTGQIAEAKKQLQELQNYAKKVAPRTITTTDDKGNKIQKQAPGTLSPEKYQQLTVSIDAMNGAVAQAEAAINPLIEKHNNLQKELEETKQKAAQGIKNEFSDYSQAIGEVDSLTESLKRMHQEEFSFNREAQNIDRQIQSYFGLSQMIRKVGDIAKDAFATVKELDKAMTQTAVVTNFSVGDMWDMLPTYTAQANQLGSTIKDVYEAATLYYQQGLNTNQAMGLANETLKMARIAGLDAAEATNMMTAALRGFNMEINQMSAQKVNDIYSELAAITASDTAEIGSAMERTASIANSANMEFATTSAFLAQMIETTREAPENLGTAMKTIVARFQEMKQDPTKLIDSEGVAMDANKVDKALKTIGVNLMNTKGEFRDLDDVFLDIASKWDSLSQGQQRYIATIAAGSRQQSRFIAMMSDYERTMELVDAANNSAGASQRQFEKTLDSMEAKLNMLKNAWDQFTMGLMNNQILKFGVDALTEGFTIVNKFIDILGKLPPKPFEGITKSALTLATTLGMLQLGKRGSRGLVMGAASWWQKGKLNAEGNPMEGGFLKGFSQGWGSSKNNTGIAKAMASINTDSIAYKKGQTFALKFKTGFKSGKVGQGLEQEINNLHIVPKKSLSDGYAKLIEQQAFSPERKKELQDGMTQIFADVKSGKLSSNKIEFAAQSRLGLDTSQLDPALKKVDALSTGFGNLGISIANAGSFLTEFGAGLGGPVGNALMTVGSLLSTVGSSLTLFATESVFATAATEALGTASWFSLAGIKALGAGVQALWAKFLASPLAPIIAAMAAIAGIAYGIYRVATADKRALESANDAAAAASEAYDSAKQETSELADSIDTIRETDSAFDGLVAGTAEFNEQLVTANEQIMALIDKYPMLNDSRYLSTDKNGLMHINEAGFEAVKEYQKQIQARASAMNLIQTADLNAIENQQKADDLRKVRGAMTQEEHEKNLRDADLLEQRIEAETKLARQNAIRTNLVDKEIADQEKLASIYVDQYEAKKQAAETEVNAMGKHDIRQAYADYHGYTYDKSTKKIKDVEGNEIDYDDAAIKDEVIEQTVMLDFEANASSLEGILHSLDRDFSKTLDKTFENGSTFISDVLSNNAETNEDLLEQVLDNPEQLNNFVEELSTKELAAVLGASEEAVESNVSSYKQQLENKLLTNAQNIIDTNAQANGELAAMLAQAQGKSADEVLISKNIQDGLIQQVKNFTAEQRNTLLNVGKILEESVGSEAMATFIDGLSNIYQTGSEELITATQDWVDSVNWETATGRLKGYNEAINMVADDTNHLGEESIKQINNLGNALLNSQDEANLLGNAFEEFYNSTDFQEMAENMDKFVDSSGQLNAASVMDMAEECHSLNNLLDTGAISAGGVATALNALGSSGDLVLSDLNSRVLELLSNFGQLDNIIASSHRNIENFDWGIDTGESADFVKESAEKWSELYNGGEVGNPQLEAYAKYVLGEEKYIALLASHSGDLQATMNDVSKYVNEYANGFDKAWDKLANGQWKDITLPEELQNLNISFGYDDNGNWEWNPGTATTEQLSEWLQAVKNIGPEMAAAMIEDWQNYSPNFRAERQKNDFEAGLDSYIEQRRGIDGGVAITASELNTIAASTGQEIEDVKAAIAERAGIEASQIDILQNINKNTGEYVTDGAVLNKELTKAVGAKGQNGWLAEYQAKDSSGNLMKNTIDIENAMAGAVERGYTAAQAKSMAYESYANAEQQGKDYYYKGELIEAGQYKTLDQFAARLEEIDQNEQWVTVGQAMADGFLNRMNQLEKPETPEVSSSNTGGTSTSNIPKGTTIPGVGYVTADGKVPSRELTWEDRVPGWVSSLIHALENPGTPTEDPKETARKESSSSEANNAFMDWFLGRTNSDAELSTALTNAGTSIELAASNLTDSGTSLSKAASELSSSAKELSPTTNQSNSSKEPGGTFTSGPVKPSTGQSDNNNYNINTTDADTKITNLQTKLKTLNDLVSQGGTYTLTVSGVKDIKAAATAAKTLTKNAGAKTISVKTGDADTSSVDKAKTAIGNAQAKIQVGANVDPATAAVRRLQRTINGMTAKLSVSIDQTGNRTVNIVVKKSGSTVGTTTEHLAKGKNNHGIVPSPTFGSVAKGKYGQLGPKGKGGLTLTGELGYEVAWLPDENRSMILGANGPQMINLPSNAVVWDHEQSKKIVKQKTIPAGSHSTSTRPSSGGETSGGGSTSTSKVVTDSAHRVTRAAETAAVKVGKVSVWWENIARTTEGVQRKADKAYSQFEKYVKSMQATLKTTGTVGQGNAYISNMSKVIGKNEAQYKKASNELQSLDNKGKTTVKWKQGKKEKSGKVNLGDYIYYDAESDSYEIDQKQINKIAKSKKKGGKAKAEAIKEAAEKKINEKLSKRNKAEDEIRKAQEALDKFGEELYSTFFKWEVELTKIWNITKQIEAQEKNISRAKTFQETIDKQISTGQAKYNDEGIIKGSMTAFNRGLSESVNKIHSQAELINQQKKTLQDTLSLEKEKTTLAAVQRKLSSGGLSDTEKVGYENYRDALQEQIKTENEARKYFTVDQNGDGTVSVKFNTEKFEADKLEGQFTEEQGKAIQDYVKKITDNSAELSDAYQSANASINELYDELSQLQNDWADYANELWDIHDKEVKERTENLKNLSDSINKALKKLLDDIKRKLDERRQQEDNRKTELDISQKQQRLAMLRADTSGGHQVEIAQLQKEIAEAQQNYQRSLEDQLLDKLQQQADLAAEQRERQIELEEEIAEGVNNAAMVDMWMNILSNPEATPEEIAETEAAIEKAFKNANEYDKKPEALRKQLDNQLNSLMLGIKSNQQRQQAVTDAIGRVQNTIDVIKKSVVLMTANISNAKDLELTVKEAHEYLGASYKDLGDQNKGKYTVDDFAKAGIKYEDAKQAFSMTELGKHDTYKESVRKELNTSIPKAEQELATLQNKYQSISRSLTNAQSWLASANNQLTQARATYDAELKKYNQALKNNKGTSKGNTFITNFIKPPSTLGITMAQSSVDMYKGLVEQYTKEKNQLDQEIKKKQDNLKNLTNTKTALQFKTGGLANYTGPAWLDGTPSKPELVLNARDTQNFLALRDVLNKAIGSTNSINNSYGGDNIFEINVNVDKIEKDYDVDRVIEKVKKEITKGAGYRNVTQVRNFR